MSVRIMHHRTEGLKNDALILQSVLTDAVIHSYEEIELVRNVPLTLPECDVQIFLEHIYHDAIPKAKVNVFVPNLEWTNRMDIAALKKFDVHIFAKTPSAYKRIKSIFANEVSFIGWTSRDMYDSSVSKVNECLHLKGVSKYKQSQELVDTWALHPEWPMLHVVSYGSENTNGYLRLPCPVKVKDNISLYQYKLNYDELKTLMNTCRYHICPSYSEGFGHYINEGRSTDSTVFTTNLSPMNELVKDPRCLFDIQDVVPVMLGQGAKVSRESLEKTLGPVFNDSEQLGKGSRENYQKERYFFEVSLKKAITKIKK